MSSTIVETTYGKVQGQKENDLYIWKGIPYAKPPIGSLRFRPPVSPEPWDGIRDATQFGAVAQQSDREIMNFLGNEMDNMSEDCLYLNIWSKGETNKRRPVMVWIHGGAYLSGSGSSAWYDGSSFAELGDVVVVTINYRLGIMGFLHLAEIGGKEYATSGNCGLLDQVVALKWVQENIENFGGDPDRVTIFGESAGAMSIGTLLATPSAKGLFHQAILQSGAANNVLTSSKATEVANTLLAALNIEPSNLEKLVDYPIEDLIEASNLVPSMNLGPVVDGVSLPKHPDKALAEGAAKDIPILIGTNKEEWRLFSFFDPMWKDPSEETINAIFEQTFGQFWPILSQVLKSENKTLNKDLYNQLMTMSVFTYPAIRLAENQLKHNTKVWMYRFDWQSPVFDGGLQSCHALEIPFVFNTLDKAEHITGSSPDRQKLSNQMHEAWIAFACNSNPNNASIPNWPAYNLENRATLIFDLESKVEFDPNSEERVKWEKATAFINQ